ncbi:DUF7687 domain-containing protein [Rhodanobacter lindaniclasticus]
MRANPKFTKQPGEFWALVRSLSEALGYTSRAPRGAPKGSGELKVHSVQDQAAALASLGLDPELVLVNGRATALGSLLTKYFAYRAALLRDLVRPNLMTMEQARDLFHTQRKQLRPTCPLPMNKQKGDKREPAYLTGLINMLIHEAVGDLPCDYDPRQLTTFTRDGKPLRTLSRRVDGAFPAAANPIGIWEVKEYYFTTTFGSRVADGVYETLLDGMELEELHRSEGVRAEHVLFIDAHYTWWVCGKSYLCRMIDMLNMGMVSEIVFGREVLDRVPALARRWVRAYRRNLRTSR